MFLLKKTERPLEAMSREKKIYQGLKSKVGLAAAKAAALRINLNVKGCGIVATPMHAPSRTPPPPPSFTQSPYPRVH